MDLLDSQGGGENRRKRGHGNADWVNYLDETRLNSLEKLMEEVAIRSSHATSTSKMSKGETVWVWLT